MGDPVEGLQREGVLDLRCGEGHSATVEMRRIKPTSLCGWELIGLDSKSFPASRSGKQAPRRKDVATALFSQQE